MTTEEAVARLGTLPDRVRTSMNRPALTEEDREAVRVVLAALDEQTKRADEWQEAVAEALELALADGDQESEKVWHGRLTHEVAVRCRAALARLDGAEGGAT